MSHSEPDWSHLPQDPEKFFELEEGYSRRDLKRKYTRLIRRYKPERHPEEFKKIRRAYETLLERLRYSCDPSSFSNYEIGEDFQEPSSSTPSPSPSFFWREELEEKSPEDLYRQLRDLPSRRPEHYLLLAYLSDFYPPSSGPNSFLQWLLEGLEAHPEDEGLLNLLGEYLYSEVKVEDLFEVLPLLAGKVPAEDFFFLTESLWKKGVKHLPFERFEKLLQSCEEIGQDDSFEMAKILFYIRLMPLFLWEGDRQWALEKMRYLEDNYEWIPPFLEEELDFLEILVEYLEVRETFVKGHPLRKRIDEVISTYCRKGREGAWETFYACQVEICRRQVEFLQAFPWEEDPWQEVFLVYGWIGGQMEMFSMSYEETEIEVGREIHQLATSLEERTDLSLVGTLWNLWGITYLALLFLASLLPLAIIIFIPPALRTDSLWSLLVLLLIGWNFYFWQRGKEKTLDRLRDQTAYYFARKCYHSLWRREFALLITQYRLSPDWIGQTLEEIRDPSLTTHYWMASFLQSDLALPLLSMASQIIYLPSRQEEVIERGE